MSVSTPETIDQYISEFPPEVQTALQEIRQTIRGVAPEAEETISYGMPTFNLGGRYLVYFAGWKKHIALYPMTAEMLEFLEEEAAGFKGTKGSIHFPLNKPMPLGLIEKIVTLRLQEHAAAQKS